MRGIYVGKRVNRTLMKSRFPTRLRFLDSCVSWAQFQSPIERSVHSRTHRPPPSLPVRVDGPLAPGYTGSSILSSGLRAEREPS